MVMNCTLCEAVVERARALAPKKQGVEKAKVCDCCGRLCCKPCCKQYLLLDNPDFDLAVEPSPDKPVRVCNNCFKEVRVGNTIMCLVVPDIFAEVDR